MQELYANCAGLDVHKQFVVACRLHVDEQGHTHQEIRKFETMLADLEMLRDWLAETGTTHVVMESTGVFWQPVYNVLEERFTVWLVNARHVKNVPGRKTDVKDAQWLAELLRAGLLRASYIPERAQRELRDLVRFRQNLVDERNRIVNRLQKVLEDANIKLSAVATDLQGQSAQAMLAGLLDGTPDPAALAELAQGRMRPKRAALERALTGRLREHHQFLLRELQEELQFLDERVARVEQRIDQEVAAMAPFAKVVVLLDSIPGVDRQTAILIVAEIGVDMSHWPTDKHLTAWAGLAPGNNETGGHARPAKTRLGNKYLRRGLVQAAHAAARKKDSYLRSLYYRLARRRGKGRAAMAVARTILQIGYHMISRDASYQDLGADYFERRDADARARYLKRELEKLDFKVTLEPAAA